MIEQLEGRRLLAAYLVDGVLTVSGTAFGDEIRIIRPKVAPDFLRISFNGVFRRIPIAEVSRIEVYGRRGNDDLSVSFGNLDPSKMEVFIEGSGGDDTVTGYLGDDTLSGSEGNDLLTGITGNDRLDGASGSDHLFGGDGADTLIGGDGDDFTDATPGDSVNGGAGLDRLGEFASPGAAQKMVYSSKYNLLFLLNAGSAVRVVDLATGVAISTRLANNMFTDIDPAPSGDFLFAADFGGETIGYGTPVQPSAVHRYDLKNRSWSGPRPASGVVYKLEAVSDSRVLTQSSDQWVDLRLLRFDAMQMTQLAARGSDYSGDIEYDPVTGRIFHGNTGISSAEVHVFRLVGETITTAESTGTYGPLGGYSSGPTTLASDGSCLYYGNYQLEGLDVNNIIREYDELIVAASSTTAISRSKVYDATTGEVKLDLGITDAVVAIGASGDFFAYSPGANKLFRYG